MGHSQSQPKKANCDFDKGQTIIGKNTYIIDSKLGTGNYGVTYLSHVKNNPDIQLTIKCIKSTDTKNEVLVLKKLKDSNMFPSLVDEIPYNEYRLIVSHYIKGTTLEEFATKYSRIYEKKKAEILYYLLLGLEELFEKGLIHNDIHSNNIIIDKEVFPRLIDFGQTCTFKKAFEMEGIDICKQNLDIILKIDLCSLALTIINPYTYPYCNDFKKLRNTAHLLRVTKNPIDSILADMIDPEVHQKISDLIKTLETYI